MKKDWIASLIIAGCIKAFIFFPLIPEIINKVSGHDIFYLINILPEWNDVILLGLATWLLLTLIVKLVIFDNFKTMAEINEASTRVDEHLKNQGLGEFVK